MTRLGQQLLARVDAASPGTTLTAADGGDRLALGLVRADTLGVAMTELRLGTDCLRDASVERVREVANDLTARVTYLLEPLTPIEFDQELAVVQLRSVNPARGEDGATYYELLVRTGGSVSLRRYRKPPRGLREAVDATVTREVLGRLADDFVASVG